MPVMALHAASSHYTEYPGAGEPCCANCNHSSMLFLPPLLLLPCCFLHIQRW